MTNGSSGNQQPENQSVVHHEPEPPSIEDGPPGQRHFEKLSDVLIAHGVRSVSHKAKQKRVEPQIEFLYSTRFFKSLIWMFNILLLLLTVVAMTMSLETGAWTGLAQLLFPILFEDGGVLLVVPALMWATGLTLIYVVCGSFFSRAFR